MCVHYCIHIQVCQQYSLVWSSLLKSLQETLQMKLSTLFNTSEWLRNNNISKSLGEVLGQEVIWAWEW